METKSVVGLFPQKNENNEIDKKLLELGFDSSKLLLEVLGKSHFILSVSVENSEQTESVHHLFQMHENSHIFKFPFVSENGHRLKEYVEASARTEIIEIPPIKEHGHHHPELNTEIIIGK